MIKKYGADILRLWASSADYRGDIRVSDEILDQMAEVYRRIRNTCRFLLGNLHDFDAEKDEVPFDEMRGDRPLGGAAHVRLLASGCVKAYREYAFHTVHQLVHNFCAVDMGGFYLDVIKDRLYCDGADSTSRRSAPDGASCEILQNAGQIDRADPASLRPTRCGSTCPRRSKTPRASTSRRWPSTRTGSTDETRSLSALGAAPARCAHGVARALERARNEKVIGSSSEAASPHRRAGGG